MACGLDQNKQRTPGLGGVPGQARRVGGHCVGMWGTWGRKGGLGASRHGVRLLQRARAVTRHLAESAGYGARMDGRYFMVLCGAPKPPYRAVKNFWDGFNQFMRVAHFRVGVNLV